MRQAIVMDNIVDNVIDGVDPDGIIIPDGSLIGVGWLYDGTTFTEPPPYVQPIEEQREGMKVSRFQARASLYNAGLLAEVQDLMDNPATDMISRLAWQDSTTFSRLSATVLTISTDLGYTDTQLDDLFIEAALITA